MRKAIFIFIAFCGLHFSSTAQQKIVYSFESPVMDSLQNGINEYVSRFGKAEKDLRLYAVIVESENEFEIYLQEYSNLPKSGLLELIKSTNRNLQINKSIVPIVIPADVISKQVKKDKIAAIPLRGYYVKVVFENYIQKVVQTSMLY